VFELNENELLLTDFNYNGEGLAPIFLAGTTGTPSGAGEVVLPFPVPEVERTFSIDDPDLPKLDKELRGMVALELPPGFTVDQLKWISVWCTRAKMDFGSLQIIKDVVEPTTRGPSVGTTRVPPVSQPTTRVPSVGNSTTRGPSVSPPTTTEPSVGNSTTIGPSVGQPTTRGPSVGNSTTRGPSVGLRELGNFTTHFSEVSGTVFELNENWLKIEDFNYDGKGIARAIFLAGTTGTPGGDGEVVLPFPVSDVERTFSINDKDLPKLDKSVHAEISLKLPQGFTVDQLKWIAVWCNRAKEVFGSLQIQ
jgi:hypothetical protein